MGKHDVCSFPGCARLVGSKGARGWCTVHYQRWRKQGDPSINLAPKGMTAEERFWRLVTEGPRPINRPELGPCLLWTRATAAGYGVFCPVRGEPFVHGHVFALRVAGIEIPPGLEVDHLCHSVDIDQCAGGECFHRRCVNVAHLEIVTHRENTLRGNGPAGINARKTHCIRGHPLSGPNLYVTPDGRRNCRGCRDEIQRQYRLRKQLT